MPHNIGRGKTTRSIKLLYYWHKRDVLKLARTPSWRPPSPPAPDFAMVEAPALKPLPGRARVIRRGRSSVVERQLPKLYVVGSIPIARSSNSHKYSHFQMSRRQRFARPPGERPRHAQSLSANASRAPDRRASARSSCARPYTRSGASDAGQATHGCACAGGAGANAGSSANARSARATQGLRIGVTKAERHQQAAQDNFADVMHAQTP